MSIERGVSRAGGRKEEVNKKGMKEGEGEKEGRGGWKLSPVPPPIIVLGVHDDCEVGIDTHSPAEVPGHHNHLRSCDIHMNTIP